jgi:hypothetical protein
MRQLLHMFVLAQVGLACGGGLKDAEQVHAEAVRYACYAEASESSERTLRDLCPVHGTPDEKAEQMSRCPAGPEVLKQLELKLQKCDGE